MCGELRARPAAKCLDVEFVVGAIRELPDDVPLQFAADFQNSTVHAPVPPEFMQAMITGSQRMPGWAWKAIAEGFIEEPAIEALARVPFPVLVMSGQKDEIFPRTEIAPILGRKTEPSGRTGTG